MISLFQLILSTIFSATLSLYHTNFYHQNVPSIFIFLNFFSKKNLLLTFFSFILLSSISLLINSLSLSLLFTSMIISLKILVVLFILFILSKFTTTSSILILFHSLLFSTLFYSILYILSFILSFIFSLNLFVFFVFLKKEIKNNSELNHNYDLYFNSLAN